MFCVKKINAYIYIDDGIIQVFVYLDNRQVVCIVSVYNHS